MLVDFLVYVLIVILVNLLMVILICLTNKYYRASIFFLILSILPFIGLYYVYHI